MKRAILTITLRTRFGERVCVASEFNHYSCCYEKE